MLKYAIGGSVAVVLAVSIFAPDKQPLEKEIAALPPGFTQIARDYESSKGKTRKAMSKAMGRCVGVLGEKPLPARVTRKLAEGWSHFATTVDGSHNDVWQAATDSLGDEIASLQKSFARMSSRKRERIETLLDTRTKELARCTVEGYASFKRETPRARVSSRTPDIEPAPRSDRDDGRSRAQDEPLETSGLEANRPRGERRPPASALGIGNGNTMLRDDLTTDPASVKDQSRPRVTKINEKGA